MSALPWRNKPKGTLPTRYNSRGGSQLPEGTWQVWAEDSTSHRYLKAEGDYLAMLIVQRRLLRDGLKAMLLRRD